MLAAVAHLDTAIQSLTDVVDEGAQPVGSSRQAVDRFEAVERARRLAAIATVDVLAEVEARRNFYDHGHANARIMFAHVAGISGAESHRLDKIRRMVADAADINSVWRAGELSVDKAALLARAFANPRTRDRFLLDQTWFLKQARRFDVKRLTTVVARWTEVHDDDGPDPEPDPSFERRRAWLSQDHFSKSWKLDAELGSLQGSAFNETFQAYVQAEFLKDWSQAEQVHGADTCTDLLGRTNEQRCADALCQIAADAVNSDKPSASVKRVHNIVWTAEAYEELLRRWVDAPRRLLDPDNYIISDLDGHPIAAAAAFADSLVQSLRRVVQDPAGVTINMSTEVRLFNGLARHGVKLSTTECYWPGCHVPTSRCHIDHLRPAARGGHTDQINGLPACPRHNHVKERGYIVTRATDGAITVITPGGDLVL